jgi:hypothetical protein
MGLVELVCYQWQWVTGCSNGMPLWLCSHHRSCRVWLAATDALDVREVVLIPYYMSGERPVLIVLLGVAGCLCGSQVLC